MHPERIAPAQIDHSPLARMAQNNGNVAVANEPWAAKNGVCDHTAAPV
jgi:hypothetical protein